MKRVEQDSGAKVKMGPGTLYGSLGRMMDAGLIRECAPGADEQDERRVFYEATGAGRKALAGELDRYREVVAVADGRSLSPSRFAHVV